MNESFLRPIMFIHHPIEEFFLRLRKSAQQYGKFLNDSRSVIR
jgi:hypothetical protein